MNKRRKDEPTVELPAGEEASGDVRVRAVRRRKREALPARALGPRPLVAIVGRPNVGKSTLFNRLAGARIAIVEDRPGVTRDRHYAPAYVGDDEVVLVDTGGFDPTSDDPMAESIAGQVRLALAEADVIVCVLDGSSDPLPADREAVALLRRTKKPVIFVANKADGPKAAQAALGLYELGVPTLLPISALHGGGLGKLEDALLEALPKQTEGDAAPELDGVPRVAIVGRPNAGKSSLVNRLLGEERQIVDARPGTTMDSIDALFDRDGTHLILIDTAGIRRRRAIVGESVESLGVMHALRSVERSDVVVLLIDATAGAAEQDARIAGLVEERGAALVVALNKVDALTSAEIARAERDARDVLSFVPWASFLKVSAKEGRGTRALIEAVVAARAEHIRRVPTAEMNRFFEQVLDRHPPPTASGRAVRLYYVTQASIGPPTFVAVTNEPSLVHFSYRRYVQNQIRERFGFAGTPIRVIYRRRRRNEPT